MYCKNCGKQIEEGTQYCKNCGYPVSDEAISFEENKREEKMKKIRQASLH